MSIYFMTVRLLQTVTLIALASLPSLVSAQPATSGREDARLDSISRNEGAWYRPKSKLEVGFRVMNSGGNVSFSNLGAIPSKLTVPPASEGEVLREYNNGGVNADTVRGDEKDADGNQSSAPGGRYDVYSLFAVDIFDADGNFIETQTESVKTGDYLSYTPGVTRQWVAANDAQLATPGYVSFSTYSTTSDGNMLSNKLGPTGGMEFQLTKYIGRNSRWLQWGLQGSIALNDIVSKTSGTVNSTLHTYTDYFSLNGQTITSENLSNPSFGPLLDADGILINSSGYETSVRLTTVPDASLSTTISTPGGAAVAGNWEVNGAYFMVRLGPSIRTQFNDRLGISASIGLAGAYAGTRYSAYESFSLPDLPGLTIDTTESNTTTKFLTGFYADLNLEWTANETLGLFGGVSAQQMGDYEQQLGDRNARIDLGTSVGLRGGVSIRF